jgi:hypothetical protein
MSELATNTNNETSIVPMSNNDMEKQMLKAAGASEFIPVLRLTHPVSEAFKNKTCQPGEYSLNNTKNLGQDVKAIVGPMRWCAMRLKDGNVDLIDYNIGPNAKYSSQSNSWEFPDGFTLPFKEILDQKIPNNGQKIVNLVGYQFLLYLPDYNEWCIWFIYKTDLTMGKLNEILQRNKGRTIILTTQERETRSNKWTGSDIRVATETNTPPNNEESLNILKKFLEPGVVSVNSQETSDRVR